MGDTIVRTPEFSNARILKPFAGFAAKYTGLAPETYPIAMPGSLDPMAGKPGYDPNLLAGVAVPMGSRVKLWLPRLQSPRPYGSVSTNRDLTYRYLVCWRVRSVADAVADPDLLLSPHFGQALPGVDQVESPIVSISSAGPRVVIPAAIHSVQLPATQAVIGADLTYTADPKPVVVEKGADFYDGDTQADLSDIGQAANSASWPEPITTNVSSDELRVFPPNEWPAPLSPSYTGAPFPGPPASAAAKVGHAGLLSQGYYSDQNGTGNPQGLDVTALKNGAASKQGGAQSGPIYDIVNLEAEGDELILLVYRTNAVVPGGTEYGWEFDGLDLPLASIFDSASPNVGAYLFTGSSAGG